MKLTQLLSAAIVVTAINSVSAIIDGEFAGMNKAQAQIAATQLKRNSMPPAFRGTDSVVLMNSVGKADGSPEVTAAKVILANGLQGKINALVDTYAGDDAHAVFDAAGDVAVAHQAKTRGDLKNEIAAEITRSTAAFAVNGPANGNLQTIADFIELVQVQVRADIEALIDTYAGDDAHAVFDAGGDVVVAHRAKTRGAMKGEFVGALSYLN
jgi:hypothetical protein